MRLGSSRRRPSGWSASRLSSKISRHRKGFLRCVSARPQSVSRGTTVQLGAGAGAGVAATAIGAVAITVDSEGRKVTGRGVATDVVEASARAYLNAVNKLVRLRERGEVREITGGP